MGDSRERGESDCRSSCDCLNGWRFNLPFKDAKRIGRLPERPRYQIEPPFPLEDMPWTSGPELVSERLMRFLRRHAPGHAQFFEATLLPADKLDEKLLKRMLPKGRKRYQAMYPSGVEQTDLMPGCKYYAVNWLHALSCVDESQSIRDSDPGDPEVSYDVLAVDPAKVPDDILIFRPAEQMFNVYIDTALALRILEAGFTGVQFYQILDDYPPEWPWRAP